MTQAIRYPIARFEPVELPPRHLIATPRNGHVIEAVPFVPEPDDHPAIVARYVGHWLVIERDPATNRVRESSGLYAHPTLAYYAYWHATENDSLNFEAWTSEFFASASARQEAA